MRGLAINAPAQAAGRAGTGRGSACAGRLRESIRIARAASAIC